MQTEDRTSTEDIVLWTKTATKIAQTWFLLPIVQCMLETNYTFELYMTYLTSFESNNICREAAFNYWAVMLARD